MPISPYTGSTLYSGYLPAKHYSSTLRSDSSSSIGSTTPISPVVTTTMITKSKPVGSSKFLSGNTASLAKTFSDVNTSSRLSKNDSLISTNKSSPIRRYLGASSSHIRGDSITDRSGSNRSSNGDSTKSRPTRFEPGLYTSKYANLLQSKKNEEYNKLIKPKEINAKNINFWDKPSYSDRELKRSEETNSISRNRQVVRLTIKREKDKNKVASAVHDSPVKTIAQKLLEKYTITDGSKKNDPYLYIPRSKRYLSDQTLPASLQKSTAKPPKPPIPTPSSQVSSSKLSIPNKNDLQSTKNSYSSSTTDAADDGDDEMSDCESESEYNPGDIGAKRYVRATKDASAKSDFQSAEEVKDAIVAAILYPGVDLESDEEIIRLVNNFEGGENRNKKCSPKRKSVEKKKAVIKVKRKKSDVEKHGDIIVDKLKRYVKQQSSIKKDTFVNTEKTAFATNPLEKKERIIPIVLQDGERIKQIETDSFSKRDDQPVSKLKPTLNDSNEIEKSSQKERVLAYQDETSTFCPRPPGECSITEPENNKTAISGGSNTNDKKIQKDPPLCMRPLQKIVSTHLSDQGADKNEKVSLSKSNISNKKKVKGVTNAEIKDISSNKSSDNLLKLNVDSSSNSSLSLSEDRNISNKSNKIKNIGLETNINSIKSGNNLESLHDEVETSTQSKKPSDFSFTFEKKKTDEAPIQLDSFRDENLGNIYFNLSLTNNNNYGLVNSATAQMTNNNNYGLVKSATTQIPSYSSKDDLGFKSKLLFNDTESISFRAADSSIDDMKPSLWKFLDASKAEEKKGVSSENKLQQESEQLNALKRPRPPKTYNIIPETPQPEDKKASDNILNARKILKRPVKPKEDPSKIFEVKKKVEFPEIKPKKVWKKPAPPETSRVESEIKNALTGLKSVKTAQINDEPGSSATVIKKKVTKDESKKTESTPTIITSNEQVNEVKNVKAKKSTISKNTKVDNDKIDELSTNFSKIGINVDEGQEDVDKNKAGTSKVLPKKTGLPKSNPSNVKPATKTLGVNESDKSKNDKIAKKVSTEKVVAAAVAPTNFSSQEIKKSETSASNLSTSLSADSAYGSSPSTPLPRTSGDVAENKLIEEETVKLKETVKTEEEICDVCGTNCHKKCEKQMPNLCGVNQKLLAEALSSVKKGSSPDGRDTFRTLDVASTSNKSTTYSSVSSSETETTTTTDDEETDTDSSEYNGPAEIRSPIQTRPKFRKYNLEDFNFIKVLGKGSFGKVMLAQQVNTENYFAVKCLKKDVVLEDNDVDCCLIERKVLTLGTKHPYLCHLFCSFQTPSHLFFVMEYLTGGDLMFHIQHVGRFDEYRACFYAAEITSGLKFLHNKGIIYRDLKLDNILLDYQGHIRIADFGMCKLQIYLDRFADTFCGTPDYMAPEVIKGQHYNQCVDWWSFGVLLYEMMIGKSPFKGCDEDHLFWLICNEEPFYPRFLSREAQSILKQLLDKDATKRLGPPYNFYGEIKCHSFFKYVDWNKIENKGVETPYKPRLRHILDVQYFDRLFTKRNAALTPLDTTILETMDQTPFKDFSYTNPNITD